AATLTVQGVLRIWNTERALKGSGDPTFAQSYSSNCSYNSHRKLLQSDLAYILERDDDCSFPDNEEGKIIGVSEKRSQTVVVQKSKKGEKIAKVDRNGKVMQTAVVPFDLYDAKGIWVVASGDGYLAHTKEGQLGLIAFEPFGRVIETAGRQVTSVSRLVADPDQDVFLIADERGLTKMSVSISRQPHLGMQRLQQSVPTAEFARLVEAKSKAHSLDFGVEE